MYCSLLSLLLLLFSYSYLIFQKVFYFQLCNLDLFVLMHVICTNIFSFFSLSLSPHYCRFYFLIAQSRVYYFDKKKTWYIYRIAPSRFSFPPINVRVWIHILFVQHYLTYGKLQFRCRQRAFLLTWIAGILLYFSHRKTCWREECCAYIKKSKQPDCTRKWSVIIFM